MLTIKILRNGLSKWMEGKNSFEIKNIFHFYSLILFFIQEYNLIIRLSFFLSIFLLSIVTSKIFKLCLNRSS